MTGEIPIILNKFPKSKQWGRDFIEQWDDIAIATIMTWMDFFHYEDNKTSMAAHWYYAIISITSKQIECKKTPFIEYEKCIRNSWTRLSDNHLDINKYPL